MTVFQRYLLIQIPGWILVTILLAGLYAWSVISLRVAIVLYAVYIVKDFVFYPFLRHAYRTDEPTALEKMAGQTGTAAEDLNPGGYVRIAGELWRAELEPGCRHVPKGSRIRVRAIDGMTLVVAPDSDSR